MRRAEAQVEVERLCRIDLLGVGDELHGLVDQVLAEVIALLRFLGRLDLVVVVHQVRVPLAGIATQEAVETLEPPAQRPTLIRARRRLLVARCQVPLAHHVGVVAVPDQDLREHPVLKRHDSVVSGEARRQLGDARHGVRVVVPSRDDAGATRRTQRRRVHVVVAEAARGDGVEVGCLDRAPEAAQVPEAGVIQDDEHDVGCPLLGARQGRPCRAGLVRGPADHTGERGASGVLEDRHRCSCSALYVQGISAGYRAILAPSSDPPGLAPYECRLGDAPSLPFCSPRALRTGVP